MINFSSSLIPAMLRAIAPKATANVDQDNNMTTIPGRRIYRRSKRVRNHSRWFPRWHRPHDLGLPPPSSTSPSLCCARCPSTNPVSYPLLLHDPPCPFGNPTSRLHSPSSHRRTVPSSLWDLTAAPFPTNCSASLSNKQQLIWSVRSLQLYIDRLKHFRYIWCRCKTQILCKRSGCLDPMEGWI